MLEVPSQVIISAAPGQTLGQHVLRPPWLLLVRNFLKELALKNPVVS